VTLHDAIADFIELYLSIDLSKKELDLIKIKSYRVNRDSDALRGTVESFRKAVTISQKHFSKLRVSANYSLPEPLEELLHLAPEDFLLILGSTRYQLSNETLSLILRIPIDTLSFRAKNLLNKVAIPEAELKNIHLQLAPLEKKTHSTLQKIKNRFRPQRFLWESAFIMFALVIVLWSIPELRGSYEKWIQKKTSEYFMSGEIREAPVPPELNNQPTIIEQTDPTVTEELATTTDEARAERKQPKATEGEVWRFSFTGSSKIDLEKELKAIVQKYSAVPPKSSIAPGGIQYDAFLKVADLIPLKMEFESLTDPQSHTLKMSWYKKKNMGTKKIPSAHVEVVIWISTI